MNDPRAAAEKANFYAALFAAVVVGIVVPVMFLVTLSLDLAGQRLFPDAGELPVVDAGIDDLDQLRDQLLDEARNGPQVWRTVQSPATIRS